MKLNIFVNVLFFSIIIESNCQTSIFQRIFEKLHKEPEISAPVFRNKIDIKYIEQKLDHFNENDNRTWQMRYMSNNYYFKENGPMFISLGGEWEISEGNLRGGHMFDMATNHSGYMFYTEHRYYGRSQPFSQLETKNLEYLNVKQSLADLAHFIRTMKATVPGLKDSKVILVGGSYSATMATWFSKLYPELVNGAWASSAPLRAKVDFQEYEEVVGASIRHVGGEACYNRIKNAFVVFEEEIANHRLDVFQKQINLCGSFESNNTKDVMTLFSSLSDVFSGLVQSRGKAEIESACELILSEKDDVEGVGKFLKQHLGGESQCQNFSYAESLEVMKNTDPRNGAMRQWYYQTCNEFGWYQTSGSVNQPFGKSFPIEFYIDLCRDVYGINIDDNKIEHKIQATNKEFGELKPEVKNVFSTHGSLDPWHAMGLLCDGECGAVIPFYSHCKDLASASSKDTPEMLKAKETIARLVNKWVS